MQNQVFAGHPGVKLAGKHELDGRGYLEPRHTGGHASGHIGGAYTGGEGTQRTVGAGVAVRADHAVTGGDDAFFRQQGMLDAHLTDIVEVENIVFIGELPALLGLGSALDILIGYKVIQHNGDMLFIKHAVKTGALKLVDGHRGGDIIAQHNVQLCVDELACLDLRQSGVCGKDLLRQGHSHGSFLLFTCVALSQKRFSDKKSVLEAHTI